MSKQFADRVCKQCGNTFQPNKPINTCNPCLNFNARQKRVIDLGGDAIVDENGYLKRWGRPRDVVENPYEERVKDWRKKARFIEKNFKTRPEWQKYFREELERIASDKILWASLTRDTLGLSTNSEKENAEPKKMGRPPHSHSNGYKYGDTRDMDWNDFDSWGYGLEEDM